MGHELDHLSLHRDVLHAIQSKDAAAARKAMGQLIGEAWADIEGHMAKATAGRRARLERQGRRVISWGRRRVISPIKIRQNR